MLGCRIDGSFRAGNAAGGEATARLLAERGCNVVLAARREDRLKSLASELGGEQALAVPTNVTDSSACAALVDRAIDHFGSLDILINNAGLGTYAPITDADPEDWRTMFDVNVHGMIYVT